MEFFLCSWNLFFDRKIKIIWFIYVLEFKIILLIVRREVCYDFFVFLEDISVVLDWMNWEVDLEGVREGYGLEVKKI